MKNYAHNNIIPVFTSLYIGYIQCHAI